MKAVMWTDTLQVIIMYGAMIAVGITSRGLYFSNIIQIFLIFLFHGLVILASYRLLPRDTSMLVACQLFGMPIRQPGESNFPSRIFL